jgi:hypothetical protein
MSKTQQQILPDGPVVHPKHVCYSLHHCVGRLRVDSTLMGIHIPVHPTQKEDENKHARMGRPLAINCGYSVLFL